MLRSPRFTWARLVCYVLRCIGVDGTFRKSSDARFAGDGLDRDAAATGRGLAEAASGGPFQPHLSRSLTGRRLAFPPDGSTSSVQHNRFSPRLFCPALF